MYPHATHTRAHPVAKEERGRKEEKGAWISHVAYHAHAERGMQMCTKRREHFAGRCSCAYLSLSLSLIYVSLRPSPSPPPPAPPLSSSSQPPGILPAANTALQTHPRVLQRRIRDDKAALQPHRPPSPLDPQRATTGRPSVGRSPGVISPEAPASEESRVYSV